MGIRGEIFSTKVQLQNRTYFFNVKENRMGDLYLNIVESKNRGEGGSGFERQSVILFAEDLKEFLTGFEESLRVLERQVRERKRNRSALFRVDRDYNEQPSESGRGDYKNREPYTPNRQDDAGEPPYKRHVKVRRRQDFWEE
ncbi:MAG: DUF3276 family protein [Spirochaetaceae bacterium]|nr:DUF3276 family protein [Spirochaetaceae bacterium]